MAIQVNLNVALSRGNRADLLGSVLTRISHHQPLRPARTVSSCLDRVRSCWSRDCVRCAGEASRDRGSRAGCPTARYHKTQLRTQQTNPMDIFALNLHAGNIPDDYAPV
eukprot:980393-Pleurochrysis_carterae.AAC.3